MQCVCVWVCVCSKVAVPQLHVVSSLWINPVFLCVPYRDATMLPDTRREFSYIVWENKKIRVCLV